MAAVPRRRSEPRASDNLVAGAGRGSSGDPPSGPPREEPTSEAAFSRGPPSLDSLEVVENIRPGGGFARADNSDSFAMEDPPSEEVRLDPRFNRLVEPATELIERDALLALANDFATEEMLAGPPPHPDEVTRPPTIELDVPMPGGVGSSPGPASHSAAPPPSLEFALPIPLVPGPATQRDLKTEKVSRAAAGEPDLSEVTVPSPHPAADWSADEASGPEVTLPAPGAFLAPDEVAVDVALERSAVIPRAQAQEPTRALLDADPNARPPNPERSSASGLREPDRSSASGLREPDRSSASGLREPVPSARAPGVQRSPTPAPAPARPSRSDAAPSPAHSREGGGLSPLVGLVALLGSGGVLAAAAAALLFALVVLYLVFANGPAEEVEAPTLPPIEVVPVEPGPEPELVEPEPEPEPEPERASQPRPRPRPQPEPPPVEEVPIPEPPPPVLPPRPILDLDSEPVVEEDDKKGKKGRKKDR